MASKKKDQGAKGFFTPERVEELETIFNLQKNDAGVVPTTELGPILRSIGLTPSVKETISYESKIDPTGKGTMEFKDFLDVLQHRYDIPFEVPALEKAFRLVSDEKTKRLHASTLKHYLTSFNDDVDEEKLGEFLKCLPLNGDIVIIDS